MPVATPEQDAGMLDAAADGGFAHPAVNVTSSRTPNAALDGFAAAASDGIAQVTVGGAADLGGGDALAGARALAPLAPEPPARAPVPVGLHTGHRPPGHADAFGRALLAASREAGRVAAACRQLGSVGRTRAGRAVAP